MSWDGHTGADRHGLHAGALELRAAGEAASAEGYRLALVREDDRWRLVTECIDGDGTRADSSWSSVAETLGEFRAEVARLWGEAVWFALLRASAGPVRAVAPAAMQPKLDLLLAGARPAWAVSA